MNKRIKITFILPSFHTGGSERVIMHLIKSLDRSKFQITLIGLQKEGSLLNELPQDIEVVFFNHNRTFKASFDILNEIKKRKGTLFVSTLNQLNLLISLFIKFFPGRIFVARESSIISREIYNSRYPRLFLLLYRTSFHFFHSLICQSEEMKKDVLKISKFPEKKIVVINNPLDLKLIRPKISAEKKKKYTFLTVGQLRKEKGHSRILRLLSKCNIPFEYIIIGDGAIRSELHNLADQLGILSNVKFLGTIPNPFSYYTEADLFIQGSYYEGFPNAVIEAQASGLPVMAIEAVGGHNEIIVNGVNGWVAKEEELIELINKKAFLTLESLEIRSLAVNRYEANKIIKAYENHFEELQSKFLK